MADEILQDGHKTPSKEGSTIFPFSTCLGDGRIRTATIEKTTDNKHIITVMLDNQKIQMEEVETEKGTELLFTKVYHNHFKNTYGDKDESIKDGNGA